MLEALEASGAYRATSLQTPWGADADSGDTLGDVIGHEERGFALAEDRATIEHVMRVITPREREVLRLRFAEDLTQAEIGERIGISQMQVSRVIRQALGRLRSYTTAHEGAHAHASGSVTLGCTQVACGRSGNPSDDHVHATPVQLTLAFFFLAPLAPLATTPVGSFGRPAALRSLRGDLGDLLGLGPGREHRRLGGEVEGRAPSGWISSATDEVLAGLGVRAVEHRRDLLEVARARSGRA